MKYYHFLKPLIFLPNPERTHNISIRLLQCNLIPSQPFINDKFLQQNIWGLDFNNPVGLAAGYDKNGEVISALSKQGFGFIETGTVTPKAQDGNPLPRLFRLEKDQAIINRMGFNNKGSDYYCKNLQNWQNKKYKSQVIVGANIGKNKTSPNNADDYITMLDEIYGLSDYITINISSPNTPNLRALQKREALNDLLKTLSNKKLKLADKTGKNIPLLLKISPDIDNDERRDIAASAMDNNIDGLIISNTTIGKRDELDNQELANQQGGLSGKPLFELSTEVLGDIYRYTQGKIPIIAAGGISNAQDAYHKIRNGASLVQIYSALIYNGFELVPQINRELIELLKYDGFKSISDAIGVDIK